MQWASAISSEPNANAAATELKRDISRQLGRNSADLVLAFLTPHYEEAYDRIPALIADHLSPKAFIGCTAAGVIGNGREIEQRPGFALVAAVVIGGGLGVVTSRNVAHAAIFLLLALGAIAGIFVLLLAEFLALVQILIYGGAVVIVKIFALMLTRLEDFRKLSDHKGWPVGAAAALAVFGLLIAAIVRTSVNTGPREGVSFTVMGERLFRD